MDSFNINSKTHERWQLTSPGETISRKVLNKFAISTRDSGFIPLSCINGKFDSNNINNS